MTASAPGKLILMGEHGAVYGRPALVVALGLRTRVRIAPRPDGRVRLLLGDLGVSETLSWPEIVAHGEWARSTWRRFIRGAPSDTLDAVRSDDPTHLVKVALAETVGAVQVALSGAEEASLEETGLDLEITSDLPVGAGFGSSASVAVAVSGALLVFLSGDADPERIDRIALDVERRQHGRPSGVDHGTVLRGGVLWMERPDGEVLRSRALDLAPGALAGLAVFQTGTPVESTGEMVESVRRRFEGRAEELERILSGMEASVVEFRDLLTGGGDGAALVRLIGESERHLEALGVVPEPLQQVVRELEALGGAAKISGAGALTGPAAGSLLAYHPTESVTEMPCLRPFQTIDAELGVAGLEIEWVA